MAGTGLAQLARASMMSASLAVIVLIGGRAMMSDTKPVSDATARPVVVARAVGPAVAHSGIAAVGHSRAAATPSTPSASAGVSGTACSTTTAVAVATELQLEHVDAPAVGNDPKHLLLLGSLTEEVTGRPVTGPVTLWRKARFGLWKSVLARRMTSAGGIVLLNVDQTGNRAVYRLTFDGDAGHGASASPNVTVTRH